MAQFSVVEDEGVRFVRMRLDDDSVRLEAGALAAYRGHLALQASIPTVGTMVTASLSEPRAVRPLLTATGKVVLESSVGGFHVMALRGESWTLERGAYWASDTEIHVSVDRERMLNALWAWDGFIDFCTRVTGEGRVVLAARDPTREMEVAKGETYAAEGNGVVIARSVEVTHRVRRPARSLIGSWLSGERALRVFTGPGLIVVAPRPYWRAFMLEKLGARPEAANALRPPAPKPEHERAGVD